MTSNTVFPQQSDMWRMAIVQKMASPKDEGDIVTLISGAVTPRKRNKRCWIHPYLMANVGVHSAFVVARKLRAA